MWGTFKNIKKKIQEKDKFKMCKVMAIPMFLHGYQIWTLKKTDQNRLQAAEIKNLRTVKGCTKLDELRNDDIQNYLGIPSLHENIIQRQMKNTPVKLEQTHIPLQAYKYCPSGR